MRVRVSLKLRRSSSGFQIRRSSANHARRALYEERVWWAVSVTFSLRAVISRPPCEKHLLRGDLAGTQAAFYRSLQDGWCFMRILVSACIVAVGCALQPPHARALTANELVESCSAVEQSAQSAPGDTVDISPEGLPCWYYMSAVQNMSASLIGRLGSSTFRLSAAAVSMSLTGSRFSSESAPRPFHHGIRGRGGTIFTAALPSNERQVQADMRTHLIRRPARDIIPPLGGARVSFYWI